MTGSDIQRVLVLFGGRSAEHEISIISARFIVASLDRQRFEPLLVGISKSGQWYLQDEQQLSALPADPDQVRIDTDRTRATLDPMPQEGPHAGVLRLADGRSLPFDIALPILHGPMGEDGCIQGLFELAQVPYVASGVSGCAITMDKVIQKQLLERAELPVLPYHYFCQRDWTSQRQACLDASAAIGFPMFVKPANMGSSLGISKVNKTAELAPAIDAALAFDTKIVVEKGLTQFRELEVSVLGNDDLTVSCAGEITVEHRDGFYSFDAKYIDDDGARLHVPAALTEPIAQEIEQLAAHCFRVLDCAGMARVDLFLDGSDKLFVNEVNAIPGFTAISMFPQLFAASGVKATELVSRLIDLGLARHAARTALRSSRHS